jgi:prepilin-type N-terminal cleavage/methylation domain-containing protein
MGNGRSSQFHGFTIVELLVVIFVIAILAAVSIVSYRGISESARNSTIEAAADAYVKIMMLYKTEHGGYPAAHDLMHNPSHIQGWWGACLGQPEDYPETSDFKEGQCANSNNGLNMGTAQGDIMYSPELAAEFKKYASNVPSVGMTKYNTYVRGFMYVAWEWGGASNANQTTGAENGPTIQFFANTPNYKCPRGWTSSANYGGSHQTRCVISLP